MTGYDVGSLFLLTQQRARTAEAERDAALAQVAPLRAFAERVAALGDPDRPDVLAQRRRVTLGDLIAESRRALDAGDGQ